jgi:hypothetical protein
MNRLPVFVATACAAMIVGGCGHSGSGDAGYRAAWQRGWSAVRRAETPYIATATSPGVCNKGGTKISCFNTDGRVGASLQRLAGDLRRVHVPSRYQWGNALTLRAISVDLEGLTLRMDALRAGPYTLKQRNGWFRESKVRMSVAGALLQRAYSAFPRGTRPAPAPQL